MWFRQFFIVFLIYNLQIVKIRCENGISLAFAIDNTRTMGKVLDDVKRHAEAILNVALDKKSNEIEDFVLVTINDPVVELRTQTNSTKKFLEKLKKINVYRDGENNDCEEMSMSGIEKALENSRYGSYMFVFTDATAKDYYKVDKIKYLCQKKQIRVIFILTGDCNQSDSIGYSVYYDVAKATSGQVFRVNIDEVDGVLNVIHDLLHDKKSVIAWKILKPSFAYQKLEFEVDVRSTSVMVSSSSPGLDLQITNTSSLLYGHKAPIQKIMWSSNAKVGKLVHPTPGKYYVRVNGSSLISVVVYATTNFTFQHGFSTKDTAKSLEYTSKQPFDNSDFWPILLQKGRKLSHNETMHLFDISQHLYIQTTDDSINVEIVCLVDMDGKDLIKLQGKRIGKGLFVTPSFTVPPTMFNIQIIGFTKPHNKLVIRVSKTPIDPSPNVTEKTLPKINIIETQRNLSYGETAEFTCTVESFTKPYIQWADEQGAIYENMPTQISATDYYLRLKVSQIERPVTYTCSAKNSKGEAKVKLDLNVPSPFDVQHRPEETIKIPYGGEKTILCDVRSSRPMKIKWYRHKSDSKSLNPAVVSNKLWISPNGSKLFINSMDLNLNGTYKCVASLINHPRNRISFDTDVVVTGLEKPEIVSADSGVTENRFWGICRVKGVPKPTISWEHKPNGFKKFHTISKSGEKFHISELSPKHSGTYRCMAKNDLGTAEVEFEPIEVIPETLPEVNIAEGDKILVDYDTKIILTCKVKAHPKPEIIWSSSDGLVLLPFKNSEGSDSSPYYSQLKFTVRNNLTYTCKAMNKKGSSFKDVKVQIRPVFKIMSIPAVTTNVKYDATVNITCDIKSAYPMNITWYKSGNELIEKDVFNTISANRTVLTIKVMAVGSQGTYTCRAYLIRDPKNRVEYTTKVEIDGLELPVINSSKSTVNVLKGDKIDLKCQIVTGYPGPQVWWYKKSGRSRQVLNNMGEVFSVGKAVLSDAGQYQCLAVNVNGNDSAMFDVTVRSYPEITVEETQRNFSYGSAAEFTCSVESHNKPIIQWTNEYGDIFENEVTQISEYNYVSRLKLNKLVVSAAYTCTATNDMGVSEANVDLKVDSPFEVTKDAEILIPYGAEKTIPCDIKSHQPMTVKWYRLNKDLSTRAEVVSSDKLSVTPDGTELIINSMDLDLNGKYACEALLASDTGEKISYSINVNVTGLAAPEIISTSTSQIDKNFTAVCKVKGVPKPVISWKFKPSGSVSYHTIPVTGEEMNIPTLHRNHSGVYKCTASNVLGQDHRKIDVVVLEVPVMTNENNKFVALKGDRVLRILCNATGSPEPMVIWKKNETKIENNSKYEVKENALIVKNLTVTDTANYTCEALNVLGTAKKTFEIKVTDTFKTDNDALKGHTYTILAIKKSPVNITCNLTSSDTMQPRWYLNGHYTNYTGSTYEIETVTKEDSGIYTCRVDSNTEATSQSFDLQVGSPPHFVYESWSPNAAIEEVLDCTVTSDPEAEVQWIHNGAVMSTGNYTQEYVANEWGEYKCIASNMFGSVERTYMTASTDCYVNHYMVTQNMPLWFTDITDFPSSSAGITLAANESIVLVCPTTNTFREFPTDNNITAQCYKEDKFIVNGLIYEFSTLQCTEKVEPKVLNTHEECSGPHTEMIKVGFIVNTFLETYQICYNKKNNVPVFGSTHIVIDDVVKEQKLFNQLPTVNVTGDLVCQGNNSTCCYSKSLLVTVDQMVFGPPQAATLIDNLNSVAVWVPCQSEDRLSWETFEWKVKAWSLEITNFKSWTGASDYRDVNGGSIPRYLWKVIKNKGEFTAVVYVNDQDPTSDDLLCSSSCESLSMLDLETESAANSFYCCSIEQFSRAFNIPSFNNDFASLLVSSS